MFASTYFLTKTKEDRPVEIQFGLMGDNRTKVGDDEWNYAIDHIMLHQYGTTSRGGVYNAKGFCVTQSIQEKEVHKLQISCEVRLADNKENYYMSLKFLGKFDGMDPNGEDQVR